ncbi:hypothetical protein [Neobacillus sp. Marseille-QA0830]
MKICEVCGQEEELDNQESNVMQSSLIHVCENCRSDRKFQIFEEET